MFTDIRLKIRNFIKRNKRKIYLILIVWAIIIVINYIIKNYDFKATPSTTYEPHTPIMGGEEITSKKEQEKIETILDTYIKYCNDKNYEAAYALLSEECKDKYYPSIWNFSEYVNIIFDTKKAYTIQNYYNDKNATVYRIRLFDDILAEGPISDEDFYYQEELVTILEEDGKTVLSINGYVGKEESSSVYEDKYIKMTIDNVSKEYDTETYTITVANKTQYRIALLDNTIKNEILLKLSVGTRAVKGLSNSSIVLRANETKTFNLTFTKYYHETDDSLAIKFNDIRVLRRYPAQYDENGETADKIDEYGVEIEIK